ncbi:MAG TPA: enolase C-terminal domain-like protein [Chloroflexota bacterium]|nr:enolase C-terminal domain-like protein [Chloroflexota bacterium]
MALQITNVRVLKTSPQGNQQLIVVKVETSDPGLYGWGCATFTQRAHAVVTAIEEFVRPYVIGMDPQRIEDIHQALNTSSYWHSGPVLNNALSGIDEALWDIKGKLANMPVYQLIGGKVREAAAVYVHASGNTFEEVEENARKLLDQGFRYIRAQVGVPGFTTYGSRARASRGEARWEFAPYVRIVPKLFEHLRKNLPEDVELLHDIHQRIPPIMAIGLAKDLDQFKLFFLEDAFAPEDVGYFPLLRQHSATPIAMGELFVNQAEYVPLVKDRLIDFMRVHISDIGGFSAARKLAAYCEFFGVRTAWHGPADVSPIGHAANLHLDLAVHNFGIQEATLWGDAAREVFPGTPEIRDGSMWANDKPGWGMDVDEQKAAKFPWPDQPLRGGWAPLRRMDGTICRQ